MHLPDSKGWRRMILFNQTRLRCCRRPETRLEVVQLVGHLLPRLHPAGDAQQRHAIRRSLGIGDADPVICTVGAVNPRKGGDMLLEAWGWLVARFPRSHVLFVGPQTPETGPVSPAYRGSHSPHGCCRAGAFYRTVDDMEAT
jgi:glycosyltransferase involved in cell wall biosynthesis